jgi:hypothetical protein
MKLILDDFIVFNNLDTHLPKLQQMQKNWYKFEP